MAALRFNRPSHNRNRVFRFSRRNTSRICLPRLGGPPDGAPADGDGVVELRHIDQAIAYIDRKQTYYDDVLSGKAEYTSNLK